MSQDDYYRVLGVPRDASEETIKRGYRRQALRWHPDKHRGPHAARAAEHFKKVSEAYQALIDPQSRAAYDWRGHAAAAPDVGSEDESQVVWTFGWANASISFGWMNSRSNTDCSTNEQADDAEEVPSPAERRKSASTTKTEAERPTSPSRGLQTSPRNWRSVGESCSSPMDVVRGFFTSWGMGVAEEYDSSREDILA